MDNILGIKLPDGPACGPDGCKPDRWDVGKHAPKLDPRCTLGKPLLMVIPPGGTTICCPVHEHGHFVVGPREGNAMSQFKCSAEDRARQLELEIWAAVDRGEIAITNGTYQRDAEGKCHACAVGSAARTICGVRDTDPAIMRRALRARGVMSETESYIMEAGFENGSSDEEMRCYWSSLRGRRLLVTEFTDESFDAFFNLGRRLRARQRPTP